MPDELHTRENCRALPWPDGGCWAMQDNDGDGYTCTLRADLPAGRWMCRWLHDEPEVRRPDAELKQGWETRKRYGASFARHHGDEATE